MSGTETVAVVVVTYNRADLLVGMLDGLAAQSHRPDAVIVIDNASTDHTRAVLDARDDLPLHVTTTGTQPRRRRRLPPRRAGGVRRRLRPRLADGRRRRAGPRLPGRADGGRRGLPDRGARGPDRRAGREGGHPTSTCATRWRSGPSAPTVDSTYADRASMPALVEVQNVAFEGFMVRRSVVAEIGFPDPEFFIFYDDVDFALRAREAGRHVWAVREAVLVRQLDFNQQHDLSGWKGFYMYPQPLRGAPAPRGERPRPAQAVADHARRGAAQPGARWPRPRRAT